jgi:hypothetical protein
MKKSKPITPKRLIVNRVSIVTLLPPDKLQLVAGGSDGGFSCDTKCAFPQN